jgi:uncharacterized membrane protein
MKKYSDMICGFAGMVIALVMFVLSIQISMKEGDMIGAGFLPQIVSVIVFGFSAVLAGRGWKLSKVYTEKTAAYPSNSNGVLLMIAVCFIYAVLLKPLGFLITSAGFLFISLCLMTKKEKINYIKFIIITIVAVLAIYLVFTELFGIRLPHGIL